MPLNQTRARCLRTIAGSCCCFHAPLFTLVFLLVLFVLQPVRAAGFLQKEVTFFDEKEPAVPFPVRQNPEPSPWKGSEKTPTAGMQILHQQKSGVQWLGGPEGAARFDPAAKHQWDRWQYFHGRAWLRDNEVRNIWGEPDEKNIWVRTKTGVSRIAWKPMTLSEKAERFEKRIEDRHVRWGMVANSGLGMAGDTSSSQPRSNDNDGLWTAMYLGAEAYRYAATRSTEAEAKARRSLDLLMRLEEISGIAGFPARSFVSSSSEKLPADGEWHPTPDGKWFWKGDTSSDELVGHYFAYALYFDLVADSEAKGAIQQKVRRITDHLIEHDFQLVDLDGKPTRWGRWSEDYFASPEGEGEAPLQSLELLSFLKTAYHITGDAKYQRVYEERVGKGYAKNIKGYRVSWAPHHINFSDDELAFLSWHPLMQFEKDASLRKDYVQYWTPVMQAVQPDHNPLWNYMAAANGLRDFSNSWKEDSIRTLQRIPLSMVSWSFQNSHRIDIELLPYKDRFGRSQATRAFAPDERGVSKWNSNPYVLDTGSGGHDEDDGAFFLLPYWMGRFYGWLND